MRQLASVLMGVVQRLVVDRTNLPGVFDFDLEFSPMPLNADAADVAPSVDGAISLFTALQEQLGLKLQSQRGQIDYVVMTASSHPPRTEPEPGAPNLEPRTGNLEPGTEPETEHEPRSENREV